MNYIGEINSFYDRLEINPLSSNAINLWHALIATANKAGWIEKFTVAISVLEVKTSLKKKSIERARNELAQKGYILWKSRNGNQSAEYSLISLCVKYNPQSVSHGDPQSVPQSVPQPVAINKLKETKLNSLLIEGEEKLLSENLFNVLNEILANETYLQMMYRNASFKSIDELTLSIKNFFVDLEKRGETSKKIEDAISHYSNWLNNQKQNLNKGGRNYEQSKSTNQSGTPDYGEAM